MTDIILKYNLLNKTGKKEVSDFMDFLLSRQKRNKSDTISTYKKKILNVSTWSDSDLKVFEVNSKHFKQWGVQQW